MTDVRGLSRLFLTPSAPTFTSDIGERGSVISVGGWQALSSGTLEEYLNIPSSPHYLTLVTNLGSITFYADKAIIPMLQYAVQ